MAPAMIDEYPIAAIAASFAYGTTIFRGLGELRLKESNRLAQLAFCLKQCGIAARESGDDLVVVGERYLHRNASIDSRGDHRIAMALATLGLASRHRVFVGQADMIATSFPSFTTVMGSLGAQLEWTA